MTKRGFTFPEVIVVLGLLSTLMVVATINLLRLQRDTSLVATVDTVMSDMKRQQSKAMVSDTQEGVLPGPYGVHLESSRYILFKGSTYSASDTTNSIVPFETNISMTTSTIPNNTIVFLEKSGALATSSSDMFFSIENSTSGETKSIQINRFGVITAVN